MFPCEKCKKKIKSNDKILVRLIRPDRPFDEKWFNVDCFFDYFENLENVIEFKKNAIELLG